jgi:two-component system cell cycle response regulator DivK
MAEELVLIVEDNARNRKLARFILSARGFRIVEAQSAEECLALLDRETPDLVLMDISLPGLDGTAALAQMRANSRTAALRVVALTAFAMKDDRSRFLAAGFDGYLSKPIDARTFADQVRAFLEPGKSSP